MLYIWKDIDMALVMFIACFRIAEYYLRAGVCQTFGLSGLL
jgi:hypothetical protein